MKKSLIYAILLVVVLFFNYDAFGLKPEDLGRYKGSIYGLFSLASIGLTLLSCLFISKRCSLVKSSAGRCLLYLFLLLVMISVQFAVQLRTGQALMKSAVNILSFKSIFVAFFILFIYQQLGLKQLWSVLTGAATACSAIALFVVLLGIDGTSIITTRNALIATGDFRTIIPANTFIAFGFISYLSEYLHRRNTASLICGLVCLGACFIQLHRSVVVTIFLILVLAVLMNMQFKARNIKFLVFLIIIMIVGLGVLLRGANYSFASLFDVFEATSISMSTTGDKSASLRFLPLINALLYVWDKAGLGIGLAWQDFDQIEYSVESFTPSPTYDSGYYNVIIVFGFVGIIVFLWVFFAMIRKLLFLRKRVRSINGRKYVNTLFLTLLYIILTSFGGDYLVLEYSAMFYITIVLLHILLICYDRQKKRV